MRRICTLLYIGLAVAALLLTACSHPTVYHRYEHTATDGWERGDTLYFSVPAVKADGRFLTSVEVRINANYPFMSLGLIVQQTVLPSRQTRCDTLNCNLISEKGQAQGQGISQYQYRYPLTSWQLREGDSLQVSVRHYMKREVLPGITDIGFLVSREK